MMKKHWKKLLLIIALALVLLFVFWWGGNAPGLRGWVPEQDDAFPEFREMEEDRSKSSETDVFEKETEEMVPESSVQEKRLEEELPPKPLADKTAAETAPESIIKLQSHSSIQTEEIAREAERCSISISCHSILEHLDWLDGDKHGLLPPDGVIFSEREVEFKEGDSVFDILKRLCIEERIHLEFSQTMISQDAYIEGLHNLYEFDCGEGSGWLYRVNGVFPSVGCSEYKVKQGDKIEWIYTCRGGRDVEESHESD